MNILVSSFKRRLYLLTIIFILLLTLLSQYLYTSNIKSIVTDSEQTKYEEMLSALAPIVAINLLFNLEQDNEVAIADFLERHPDVLSVQLRDAKQQNLLVLDRPANVSGEVLEFSQKLYDQNNHQVIATLTIRVIGQSLNIVDQAYERYLLLYLLLSAPLVILLLYFFNAVMKNLEQRIKANTITIEKQASVLAHRSKQEAMGEMLEKIAHQWRQPLNIIGLSITQLETQKALNQLAPDAVDKNLSIIAQQTKFMSDTIDTFRNFLKEASEIRSYVVANSIRESLSLIEPRIKEHDITVIEELDESIVLEGKLNMCTQTLLVLLNNAIDQIALNPDGPRVIRVVLKEQNSAIVIQVNDSGGGFAYANKERLFEPYFSTKHQKSGTGLGLYVVYDLVVYQMNGSIEASNEYFSVDEATMFGAQFTLTIPKDRTSA